MNRIRQYLGAKGWSEEPETEFGDISVFECESNEWQSTSPTVIQDLKKQLSGKVDENSELKQRVDELTEKLEERLERLERLEKLFEDFFSPINLPSFGTFEEWLASKEANAFRGKHIAFIDKKGVIASANSLEELMENVLKNGRPEGLIIGFVPSSDAFISV